MTKDKKPIRRVVSVEFWNDDKVLDSFSPEDKLFMLYLLTNPHSTQVGVYNINKKTMAYELGYSVETINVLMDRFENTYGMIRYSPETHEVAIKNYLRHSILNGGLPVEDLLRKEMMAVIDKTLLDFAFKSVINDDDLNASVRKIINEFYALQNLNDESYTESLDESPTNRGTSRITNGTPSIINNHISNINSTSNNYGNPNNIYIDDDEDNNACARVREGDTPETSPNAYGDADDGNPIAGTAEQYAIDNLRVMTPGNLQECGEFIDKHGVSADVMKYAIDVACGNGSPVWNYVASILYQWLDAGVKTVGDAKQQREKRRAKRDTATPQNTGRVVPAQRKTAAEESAEFWANVPRY